MDHPRDLRTREQVLADAEAAGVDLAAIDRLLRMSVEQRLLWLDAQIAIRKRLERPLLLSAGRITP